MFESLEHRRLMRGGVVRVDGDTLYVSGTAGDDAITLGGNAAHLVVTLNGRRQTFPGTHVRRVVVYAGGGDDVVDGGEGDVSRLELLRVPASIDGGTGDDTLFGGDRADTLLGGTGDDRLYDDITFNTDFMDGGPGNDRLSYGSSMNGGRGDDTAIGGYGTDPIVSGVERLYTISEGRGSVENPGRIDRSDYRGDLTTRNGRLVFHYPIYDGYDVSLSGPTVRADGLLRLTLKARFHSNDYVPPRPILTVSFDRGDAVRRGVVLAYEDPSGTFTYLDEQLVLLPST